TRTSCSELYTLSLHDALPILGHGALYFAGHYSINYEVCRILVGGISECLIVHYVVCVLAPSPWKRRLELGEHHASELSIVPRMANLVAKCLQLKLRSQIVGPPNLVKRRSVLTAKPLIWRKSRRSVVTGICF